MSVTTFRGISEAPTPPERKPTVYKFLDGSGHTSWTDCPECGPDVAIDEDGCCRGCGADAAHFGRES